MAKKSSKKKISKKKSQRRPVKTAQEKLIEDALIQNFVSIQKVMLNLSEKIGKLSDQVSSLLQLFEISAKTLAAKEGKENKSAEEIKEKLEKLIEQNKLIARGITLVSDKGLLDAPSEEKNISEEKEEEMPKAPVPIEKTEGSMDINEYQKSISSQNKKFNPLPKF